MSLLISVVAAGAAESGSAVRSVPAMPLWDGAAPGALGAADQDRPTLTPFLPPEGRTSGAALVICPGGGYGHLAAHEGEGYARYFAGQGIACFVLKYRLGSHGYRHPVMLQDAQRAIRTVRARASEWGLDPKRVGIIGSSAGGHLASTAATHFSPGKPDAADVVERESSRPDVALLCYPVISMGQYTHGGSKRALLGTNPPPDLVELLSNEKQVTRDTPPCFVWHTADDRAVPVENSLLFAGALQKAGVPYDLHIYQSGRHGLGLGDGVKAPDFSRVHPWAVAASQWLRQQKFIQ